MTDENTHCPGCRRLRPQNSRELRSAIGHTYGPCCNPECKGEWGTGCYHCHHPSFWVGPGAKPPEKKTMTPDELHESQELVEAHQSLKYQLGYNGGCYLDMDTEDPRKRATQVRLPPSIGHQVLEIALSLTGNRLRALGVEVSDKVERDCFECNGTGKVPIGDSCG